MGWAARANPKSWENRTEDERVKGIQEIRAKELRRIMDREGLLKFIAEHRRRRAAVQGVVEAKKEKAAEK